MAINAYAQANQGIAAELDIGVQHWRCWVRPSVGQVNGPGRAIEGWLVRDGVHLPVQPRQPTTS